MPIMGGFMSKKRNATLKKSPKAMFSSETKARPSSHRKWMIPLGILACALVVAIFLGLPLLEKPGAGTQTVAATTEVTYPVSQFADGKARHYAYQADEGNEIRYFILKSADGVIRAAFDACDVCWPENKGYYQEGDTMVCRNCGRRFASVKVNEVRGGCNPAPLERSVVGDSLVLRVQDILEGKKYFDFSGRG